LTRFTVDLPDTVEVGRALDTVLALQERARVAEDSALWHDLSVASGVLEQVLAGVSAGRAEPPADPLRVATRAVLNVARGQRDREGAIAVPRVVIDEIREAMSS